MRDQFIPVRKSDIVEALLREDCLADAAEREGFRQLSRLLGLVLHYEFFDELERVKDAYFHFSPRATGAPAAAEADREAAYAALTEALGGVLARANFVEVPAGEIARSYRERGLMPVKVQAPVGDYREIRFFRRGQHRERVVQPARFSVRERIIECDVHDDVVLLAAAKPVAELAGKAKRFRRRRRKPAPGAVFIKLFHDIASADLNTLLPDVKVVMNRRDRWVLGVPALVAGVPLVLKLAPTLTILFVLLGVQLGYSGAVEEDGLKTSLAVLSGFIALGSFVAHQWLKYQRTALRYQVEITDSIYFRNESNNAGVFDALIGAAEEQEWKEAVLAYHFLRAEPSTGDVLDRRIEAWLQQRFGVAVDFEVDDGLAKLRRYGLLAEGEGCLSVVPIGEALQRLDRLWDGFFAFDAPRR
jgi:hypothetical protein